MMAPHTLKYRGPIQFTPERQPDGKWTIRGVPIFECHESDDPNYCRKVDSAWMYACVRDQQELKAGGFLPRLFIGHTDDQPGSPEKPVVGYLDNYRFDPKENWLFADYVGIEDKDIEAVKRFPGRSVEASKVKPAIRGVALLGATPPYFKLPDVKFKEGEQIARYSVETQTMPVDPKAAESSASSPKSAEEQADYEKFRKYMAMYEAEKKTNEPAPAPEPKPALKKDDPEKKEPAVAEQKFNDTEAAAKYAELTTKYESLVTANRDQAAKIVALEEAGERATWTAKYAEARIPANRIDIPAKVDLLMKMPKDVRQAFYDDSLKGLVAPATKPIDTKDHASTTKPEPGSAEEAAAVKAKYEEWRSKGTVKTYAEAQAKYIREER